MMWPFKNKWAQIGIHWDSSVLSLMLVTRCQRHHLVDDNYRVIEVGDFDELMWMVHDVHPKYRKDIADCDDRAKWVESDIRREWAKRHKTDDALAFGYAEVEIETGAHALIWHINKDGVITFYEPATFQIFEGKIKSVRLLQG